MHIVAVVVRNADAVHIVAVVVRNADAVHIVAVVDAMLMLCTLLLW